MWNERKRNERNERNERSERRNGRKWRKEIKEKRRGNAGKRNEHSCVAQGELGEYVDWVSMWMRMRRGIEWVSTKPPFYECTLS